MTISDEEYGRRLESIARRDRVHLGIARDTLKAELNVEAGNVLCENCQGTGNQLYSMYQKCDQCDGTGVTNE